MLLTAASPLLRFEPLVDEVLATLNDIAGEADFNPQKIFELVAWHRRHKWRGISRKAAVGLRDLDKRLAGKGLSAQIKRWILFGNWVDVDRPGKGPHGKQHGEKVRTLARAALWEPKVLERLLPVLSASDGFALRPFGFALGEEDLKWQWWDRILGAFTAAGEKRNSQLAAGYLSAVFQRDRTRWEAISLALLRDELTRLHAGELIVRTGLTDGLIAALCRAVHDGELALRALHSFGYAARAHGISTERSLDFIRWCVAQGSPERVMLALETASVLFCFDKNAPPLPEQPILDLLVHPRVFRLEEARRSHYEWAELTKGYVEAYPHHAMRLLESVLTHFDDHDFVLGLSHSQAQEAITSILRREPGASWLVIAGRLESPDRRLARHLLHWLGPSYSFGDTVIAGPMGHLNPDDILKWVSMSPADRAPAIAGECPKSFNVNEGGMLARELLIRYGDNEEVQAALRGNFGSEGWSGKASEHYRAQRDKVRRWLAGETAEPVVRWIENYIDYLNRQITHQEIIEEREY